MHLRFCAISAVCALAISAQASNYLITATGTVTSIQTTNRLLRHVHPGTAWQITMQYSDDGVVNGSMVGGLGQWVFPVSFTMNFHLGLMNIPLECAGINVYDGLGSGVGPLYGISLSPITVSGNVSSRYNLSLLSTSPILNSISLPSSLPGISAFNQASVIFFRRDTQTPQGTVTDLIGGYITSVSLTKLADQP